MPVAILRPSRASGRPREERGLLRMRSEGLIASVRYDGFHGIDPLARHHSDVLRMGESGPQETLGNETEEIARRLQTVIYIDISLVHTAA